MIRTPLAAFLFLLGISTISGPSDLLAQSPVPKEHASWWIGTYGLVDSESSELAQRAHEIFERLAAAADKRSNRMPRLVIIDTAGSPFAMALSDGSILLTRGALDICLSRVSGERGSAQLAFVLGHELAHLSNDDFWHAAAFHAVDVHGPSGKTHDLLLSLSERGPEEARRLELQADAFGMLYMMNAGFDPRMILGGQDFFSRWAGQMETLGIAPSSSHPGPGERAAFVASQMAAVTDELDLYDFGVRLFQLGRFEDAIVLLGRFGDRFPSVEVLNNIGLSHFQLAAWFLSRCDERLVVAFKVPTMLDPSTRAQRLRAFQTAPSPCFRNERFSHHYETAQSFLRQAADKSADYMPARLNLVSLHILGQRGTEALAAAQAAQQIAPDNPAVLAARAAAIYLIERETNLEMADAALSELQRLSERYPDSPYVAYNLGALLADRRRVESAKQAWRTFLELEPTGLYADAARDYLGEPPLTRRSDTGTLRAPSPPVPLGQLDMARLSARFPGLTSKSIEIGSFHGEVLQSGDWRAFAMESVVELVEQKISAPLEPLQARARWGSPIRTQRSASGELWYFPTFAVEVVNGQADTLLFFGETRIP